MLADAGQYITTTRELDLCLVRPAADQISLSDSDFAVVHAHFEPNSRVTLRQRVEG